MSYPLSAVYQTLALYARGLRYPDVPPVVHPLEANALDVPIRLLARLRERRAGGDDGEHTAACRDQRAVVTAARPGMEGNPIGIEVKGPQDTIPFHPYYTVKDYFGIVVFFIFYAGVVFFAPDFFGEPDNYIPANPLLTPLEIVPEWYFLPFYAILRAIPDDLWIMQILPFDAKLGG